MLDKLSETWQGTLDAKDSEISRLQAKLTESQAKPSAVSSHRVSILSSSGFFIQ